MPSSPRSRSAARSSSPARPAHRVSRRLFRTSREWVVPLASIGAKSYPVQITSASLQSQRANQSAANAARRSRNPMQKSYEVEPHRKHASGRTRQKRSEATRNSILEASIEMLSTDGGTEFNTNRISRRAGVSIGTLYQYFENREAILLELSRQHQGGIAATLAALTDSTRGASFEDAARTLIRATIEVHAADPRLHEALSRIVPSQQANEQDGSSLVRASLAALYRRHQAQLRVDDIDLAAFVTYEMVAHLVHRVVAQGAYPMTSLMLEDVAFRAVKSYLDSG